MQKSHNKNNEFSIIVLDKKNKVIYTAEWTNKPIVELHLSKKKAKKVRFLEIIKTKTAESIVWQNCILTGIPKEKVPKKQLCTVQIDLSNWLTNVKKLLNGK